MTERRGFAINFKGELVKWCFFLTTLWSGGVSGRNMTVKNCGVNVKLMMIVGGSDAPLGKFPWMVSLHELGEHICGGTIINEHWIVTAAHCIEEEGIKDTSMYTIHVGLNRLSKKEKGRARKYEISEIILHEDYDDETYENDIALLRTATPIDFEGSKGFINGICLPETAKDPAGWAIVSGWGHMIEGGYGSDRLKEVKVPVVPRDMCSESYEEVNGILKTMICAGIVGKDSCQADSGGPLVQKDQKGVYTLIGVVSFGIGCGERYYPGVYTNVATYMDWMESKMNKGTY